MKQNSERQKKHGKKKENNSDENEIPDLNSFEFEPKTNIGDINSSSSDDEEEGAEYKVKRISNSE